MEKSVVHCVGMGKPDSYTNADIKKSTEYENAPKRPCHAVVMHGALVESMKTAFTNLGKDGFVADCDMVDGNKFEVSVPTQPRTKIGKAIAAVISIMKKVEHTIYLGDIYCKANGGKQTHNSYNSCKALTGTVCFLYTTESKLFERAQVANRNVPRFL